MAKKKGIPRGRTALVTGYQLVAMPEHPDADERGYVYEHRLLAERALGKPLPKQAQIHHADGDPTNNAPGNLVICDSDAYHKLLHQRQRALEACGDPNAIVCKLCGSYERQDDIREGRNRCGGREGVHRSCFNAYKRRWRAKRKV